MPYPEFTPLRFYTEPSQAVLDRNIDTDNAVETLEAQGVDAAPESWLDKTIDFSSLEDTTGRRAESNYLSYIYKKLKASGMDDVHAAALLGTISEESGGDPFAVSNTGAYQGIMQWSNDRYRINPFYDDDPYKELDRQVDYLLTSLRDPADGKSWIDPGMDTGSGRWAMEEFWDSEDVGRMNYLLNKYYSRSLNLDEDIERRDVASRQSLDILDASKPASISALDRSNAPFARDLRMGSEARGAVVDMYYPPQMANYKMASGSDEEGSYVYPMIQKEGDQLVDYSRVPYGPFAADDAAHESGNLVRMPEEDAQWVAENNYKNYYPGFNTFAEGGNILAAGGTTWGEDGFLWKGPDDQEAIVQGEAVPVPPEVEEAPVVARPSVSIAPPTLLQAYSDAQMGLRNQIAVTNWGGTVPTAEQKALQDSIIANIDNTPVDPSLEAVLTPRDATRVVSPVYPMTPEAPKLTEDTQMLEAVVRGDNTNKYIEDKIKALHNGDELRQFQEKLIDLGYDLHKFGADGKIGKETRAAARKYYKDMLENAKDAVKVQKPLASGVQEAPGVQPLEVIDPIVASAVVEEADPVLLSFPEYMYRSGSVGNLRRAGNVLSVSRNYLNGLLNPHGSNATMSEGARRQMLGASLAHYDTSGNYGVTDVEHEALGGIGAHSGIEFRTDTNRRGYIAQAADAPYHNIYGQSGRTYNPDTEEFSPGADAYTFNNVWTGDKVTDVMEDGAGTSSLSEAFEEYARARESGATIKAALESAASMRGVAVSHRKGRSNTVGKKQLEKYKKEYERYLSDERYRKRFDAKWQRAHSK